MDSYTYEDAKEAYPTHEAACCEVARLRGIIARNKAAFNEQRTALQKAREMLRRVTKARDELFRQLTSKKPREGDIEWLFDLFSRGGRFDA